MAAIIMWLRGYHAGKTGVIPSHSNVPLPLSPALRGRPDGLFASGVLREGPAKTRVYGLPGGSRKRCPA
jgi:hypothetical protein